MKKIILLVLLLLLVILLHMAFNVEAEEEYYDESDLYIYAVSSPFVENQVLASVEPTDVAQERYTRITAYAPLDPRAKRGMCYSGDRNMTASGSQSRRGVVATNYLPFGTRIRIPEFFGDEVFVVEDRMASYYRNTIDVLMIDQDDALSFGVRWTTIEILE